jgi:hypothetical protein
LFTLAQSASVVIASWILENKWLSIQHTMVIFALGLAVTGVIWHFTIASQEQEYQHKSATAQDLRV